jgi:hypothetical protein
MGDAKKEGGLGFRDLECFNTALLAKQGWRLLQNPDSLVAKILKEKYFPNGSFLDSFLSKRPSYIWRSIWNAKPLIQEGMVWRVGNGRNIKIWGDKWLPSPTTHTIQSPIRNLDGEAKVCELIDQDLNWWNIPLIKEVFRKEEAEMICGMAICPGTQQDCMVWAGNKSGLFTVRSAYHLAKEVEKREVGGCSGNNMMTHLWNKIWQLQVPRVVTLFLWQACNNVLPTKENLFKRKITDDPRCPVCLLEEEMVGHALWSCTVARDVWLELNAKIQKSISEEDEFNFILQRLLDRLEGPDFDKVVCTARQIWLRRNKWVFEGQLIHPKNIAQVAVDQLEFHCKASQLIDRGRRAPQINIHDKWTAPGLGYVKIN